MFDADRFQRLAHNYVESFDKVEACPDQWVGNLDAIAGKEDFPFRRSAKEVAGAKVILILESPHRAEYDDSGPIGPARGAAGAQIRKHLPQIAAQIAGPNLGARPEVVLMNAIQFPCSLFQHHPGKTRNKMFLSSWDAGGEADFRQRFREMYKSGDLVINGCTQGERRNSLRGRVNEAVLAELGTAAFWRIAHPVSWFRNERNRKPTPVMMPT